MFIGLMVILSGCNYNEEINVVFFEQSDYGVYLYSNGENEQVEHDYLSAIVNLRISHPDIVNEMVVEEASVAGLRKENISEYPALLITKNGKIIDRFSGEQNREEILDRLETIILSESQTAHLSSNN